MSQFAPAGNHGILVGFGLCSLILMICISSMEIHRAEDIQKGMHMFLLLITLEAVYTPQGGPCTVVVPVMSFITGLFSLRYMEVGLIPKISYKRLCLCTQAFGRTIYFQLTGNKQIDKINGLVFSCYPQNNYCTDSSDKIYPFSICLHFYFFHTIF